MTKFRILSALIGNAERFHRVLSFEVLNFSYLTCAARRVYFFAVIGCGESMVTVAQPIGGTDGRTYGLGDAGLV